MEAGKKALGESKDHEQLEENLKKVNEKVDEMEKHFRDYHTDNSKLISAYPTVITAAYQTL